MLSNNTPLLDLYTEVDNISVSKGLNQEQKNLLLREKMGTELWWECINEKGDLSTCKILFERYKFNQLKNNINNITCISAACSKGNLKIAKWLYTLKPNDIYVKDKNNDNAISKAMKNNQYIIIKWMIVDLKISDFSYYKNSDNSNFQYLGQSYQEQQSTRYITYYLNYNCINDIPASFKNIIELLISHNVKTNNSYSDYRDYAIYDIFNHLDKFNYVHKIFLKNLYLSCQYQIIKTFCVKKKLRMYLNDFYINKLNQSCVFCIPKSKKNKNKLNIMYQKIIHIDLVRDLIIDYLILISDNLIKNLKIFSKNYLNSQFFS